MAAESRPRLVLREGRLGVDERATFSAAMMANRGLHT